MVMFRSLGLRGKQKEVAAVFGQHGRAELKQEETRVVFSVSVLGQMLSALWKHLISCKNKLIPGHGPKM